MAVAEAGTAAYRIPARRYEVVGGEALNNKNYLFTTNISKDGKIRL